VLFVQERWRATLWSSGANALVFLSTGLALVLAARLRLPSEFGDVAAGYALAILVASIGNLSLGQVAHHIATTEPGRWRQTMPWLVAILTLGFSLLVAFAILVLRFMGLPAGLAVIPARMVATAMILGPLLALELNLTPLIAAGGHLSRFNFWRLAGRIVTVLATAWMGLSGAPTWAMVAAHLPGPLLACAIGYRVFLRASSPSATGSDLSRLLRGIALLHPAAIGAFAMSWFNVLLVTIYSGSTQAGFYLTAWTLVQVILTAPQGAMNVLMGHVANDGPDEAWRAGNKEVVGLLGLSIAAMAVGWLASGYLVTLVFGNSYAPVIPVFRILVLVVPGAAMGLLMTPQWIGRGLFLGASAVTVVIGAVSVLLCRWFAPGHGAAGAAVAAVVAYTLSLVVQVAFAWRLTARIQPIKAGAA
jgi:O-antigen/teichoic acid export membrane protein